MSFADDQETVKPSGNPVFLLTATLTHDYKTYYSPDVFVVHVERVGASGRDGRLNFRVDPKAKEAPVGDSRSYLFRMELPPGDYEIKGMSALASRFPLTGFFFAPVHAAVKSSVPGIFYLGHVEANTRERVGNEFRSGPPLPLLDQGITGASGSTFDIVISDRFAEDEAKFRQKFSALRTAPITVQVLPPFDRPKAQAWWEKN